MNMRFYVPDIIHELPSRESVMDFYGKFFGEIVYKRYEYVYHRTRLSEAQNHKCCWCGVRMTEKRNKSNSSTIEHVTPKSEGGLDHPDNFAIACNKHNRMRGILPVNVFMEKLAKGESTKVYGPKKYANGIEAKAAKWDRKIQKEFKHNRLVWC